MNRFQRQAEKDRKERQEAREIVARAHLIMRDLHGRVPSDEAVQKEMSTAGQTKMAQYARRRHEALARRQPGTRADLRSAMRNQRRFA